MVFKILHGAAATAWAGAADQPAQLSGLAAQWPGDVSVRAYSAGGLLLGTATHPGWTMVTLSGPTRKALALAGLAAWSPIQSGAAAYVVCAVPGGADILRADVSLVGAVGPLARMNLGVGSGAAGLLIEANSGLSLDGMPAWRSGSPLNAWTRIAGTSGAGGASVDPWCGIGLRPDTSELFIAAAGGHTNSSDNRVVSLSLLDDAPAWILRIAASVSVQPNVAWYADNTPSSRHTYYTSMWSAHFNRLLLVGSPWLFGDLSLRNVAGYNPAGPSWDPPSTYDDVPVGAFNGAVIDGDGNIWTETGNRKWTVATNTWSAPISPPGNETTQVRFPWAYDSLRHQVFGMCVGDGQASGSGWGTNLRAVKMSCTGTPTQVAVTFRPSAALDALIADNPSYAALAHDPVNDFFLWYEGEGAMAGKGYVVIPNDTNVWDVDFFVLASEAVMPPSAAGSKVAANWAGVTGRLHHVPSLGGFVLLPRASSDLYFLRTS